MRAHTHILSYAHTLLHAHCKLDYMNGGAYSDEVKNENGLGYVDETPTAATARADDAAADADDAEPMPSGVLSPLASASSRSSQTSLFSTSLSPNLQQKKQRIPDCCNSLLVGIITHTCSHSKESYAQTPKSYTLKL